MIQIDRTFSESVERAVRRAEGGTSAELIVVIAARSGPYLDVALGVGAVCAAASLLVALFARSWFPPVAVAIEVPLVFVAATWIAHRSPPLLRALAPASRRKRQVERAAASHFLDESVHGTRGRTGLLIYVSRLEERVALVPDLGLTGIVAPAAWETARSAADVVRGIEEIGALLRTRLPGGPGDANESADTPRFVS
ncbi:MAG TPA: hypothetical protein VFB67_04080 [Candidatus Polarisedimenticolaceae bacterium]|nr:hypothetical protein [Candidatus Polarisedimenticolaceae bacterium]